MERLSLRLAGFLGHGLTSIHCEGSRGGSKKILPLASLTCTAFGASSLVSVSRAAISALASLTSLLVGHDEDAVPLLLRLAKQVLLAALPEGARGTVVRPPLDELLEDDLRLSEEIAARKARNLLAARPAHSTSCRFSAMRTPFTRTMLRLTSSWFVISASTNRRRDSRGKTNSSASEEPAGFASS